MTLRIGFEEHVGMQREQLEAGGASDSTTALTSRVFVVELSLEVSRQLCMNQSSTMSQMW